MRSILIFLAACAVAALIPLLGKTEHTNLSATSFPGWPVEFESRLLTPLPLSAGELRFERDFAGRIARFSNGEQEIAIRWVTEPTRSLHPASDCLKASGYEIQLQSIFIDAQGQHWGSLLAKRDGRTMRVRERIYDSSGKSWTDVSAWYWDGLLKSSHGPWWAITIAESVSDH
ncbi:MAG TPA: hypothetical protein VEF04_13910 [Blastocatellia bacterium]|nr:hypothetical protein [Blastocatellia bacterium]